MDATSSSDAAASSVSPAITRAQRSHRLSALLLGATLLTAACAATDTLVIADRSDQIRDAAVIPEPPDSVESTDPPVDPETPTTAGEPSRNEPINPVDPMLEPGSAPEAPEIDPAMIDRDAVDFGDDKPPQPWDEFVLVALADVEGWLIEEFPAAFGMEFEPLQGGVFAAFPERTAPIPGCGTPSSSFEDIQRGGAIYCFLGDFIAYDDTPQGVVGNLASQFGPVTFGIVMAHEYGHAIQDRTDVLRRSDLLTVDLEQQADCVAGAWAGRAAAGQAPGVPFDDADVRAGLISMISIQDPVGTVPTVAGGHGSGFDRVGAFQVGFNDGLARCQQLIDDPLPLTPIALTPQDAQTGGDAPFGFDAENDLFAFLTPDLNLFYGSDLSAQFPRFTDLTLVPVQSEAEVVCNSPTGFFDIGMELCTESNTVFLNEPVARQLYDDFGDFGPAYLLGLAWAEHAQNTNNSVLSGEPRQLQNDCLSGAWVSTVIPDINTGQLPEPRDVGRTAVVSANDLTEAVLTAIVVGDPSFDTNVLGSAFEKIDQFRRGTLGGIDACG
ncbi:MAG: hypothetical protein AB8G14_04670 [Ilumatobacter sp.]